MSCTTSIRLYKVSLSQSSWCSGQRIPREGALILAKKQAKDMKIQGSGARWEAQGPGAQWPMARAVAGPWFAFDFRCRTGDVF